MKIVIDARAIEGNLRGTGYFLNGVLRALAKIDTKNEYILLVRKAKNINFDDNKNFTFYEVNLPIGIFEIFGIPILINFIIKPDIIWFPANNCAPLIIKKIKVVCTLLDIMFYTHKYKFFSKQYLGAIYRKIFSRIAIKRANKINTISKYSKEQIMKFFNISDSRIFYTYLGSNRSSIYDDSILEQLNLINKKYIYSITGTSPNKNLPVLINSFYRYYETINDPYCLVLTGVNSRAVINSKDGIKFTGYITDAQKNSLLKNCNLFLFLSKDEGFGYPPLEALLQNSNVLLSDIPIFHELYDSWASFTAVNDVDIIANDIAQTIAHPFVAKLDAIENKFSWDNTGKMFFEQFTKLKYGANL